MNTLRTPASISVLATTSSMSVKPSSPEMQTGWRVPVWLRVARKEAIGQRDVVGVGGSEGSGGPYDHHDRVVPRGRRCEDWRPEREVLEAADDGSAARPPCRRGGRCSGGLPGAGTAQIALIEHVPGRSSDDYVGRG